MTGLPPGLRCFDRSRCDARRAAFRRAFAASGSLDGGVEEFPLSIRRRRSSSATRSSSLARLPRLQRRPQPLDLGVLGLDHPPQPRIAGTPSRPQPVIPDPSIAGPRPANAQSTHVNPTREWTLSETCTDVGGFVYSLHQTSDGGYLLAGDSNLEMSDGAPIEAWQAKVDATGNLVWQHLYYQTYAPTGRPLGGFFPAAAPAPGGGSLAVGPILDYPTQKDLLFTVRTDTPGLAGTSRPDVHPAIPLQAINPQLTPVTPALPLQAATTPAVTSPIATLPTSISSRQDC